MPGYWTVDAGLWNQITSSSSNTYPVETRDELGYSKHVGTLLLYSANLVFVVSAAKDDPWVWTGTADGFHKLWKRS